MYDVGQGACNALLDQGAPTLYFDFGGGCLWNGKTYPKPLKRFCFGNDPPILLSHWDQDHWAAVLIDTHAQAQPWIVPLQTLTLSSHQLSFLLRLLARTPRRLYVWGTGLPQVVVGVVEIQRVLGSSINDSGLALYWHEAGGGGRMLFPADARYDDIPGSGLAVTSLVVSHHGGYTGSGFVPPPDGSIHGRLVYSFGPQNTYHHPLPQEEQDHANLWGTGLRTESLRPALGHIQLDWTSGPTSLGAPCQGLCQLDRTQT